MIYNQLAALTQSPSGTGDWQVESFDADNVVFSNDTLTLSVPAPDLKAQLKSLADVGRLASQLVDALDAQARVMDLAARDRAREAVALRYTADNPEAFGLVQAGDHWALPDSVVDVTIVAREPARMYAPAQDLLALDVRVDGVLIGQAVVDVDGTWRVEPQHKYLPSTWTVSALDRARLATLGDSPWADMELPPVRDAVAAIDALVSVAPDVTPWVQAVDVLLAEAEALEAERAAAAVEWRRLSRSRGRLPTKALNTWMARKSHVDYTAEGVAVGGWRVVARLVSGRDRPTFLDKKGPRTKAVGVAQVLYVARLEHESVRRSGDPFGRFYNSDLESLRTELPDCVVRMPEDGKVIFISTNDPQHVTELEAAMVEWVVLNT